MVGNERKHVVLHVVIHVPIEESVNRVHVNGPAIEAVIEDIFGEARVLSKTVNNHQPGTEKVRKPDEKQRQKAVCGDGCRNHGRVNEK